MKVLTLVFLATNWVLGRFGYRLSNNRPTILRSLNWLKRSGIDVRTVLDVGASDGSWSKGCMRAGLSDANYVLFEPNPAHREKLFQFSSSHKLASTCFAAVSDQIGTASFQFTVDDPLAGALSDSDEAGTPVQCTTIDTEVSVRKCPGPYLLKLDTHGFEREILQGSQEVLRDTSVIVIEAYAFRLREKSLLFWELCELLQTSGFRCIDIVDPLWRRYDGAFWQADLVFIRSDWPGFEYRQYA